MKRFVLLVAGLLLLSALAAEAVDVEAGLSWCESQTSGWSRVRGGTPQRGDILVYTGAKYGHVAIYAGGKTSYHQNMAGQYVEKKTNWPYNNSWYSKAENGTKSYWGYIRPGGGGSPVPPTPVPSANISYRAHVAFEGWQGWVSSGQMAGTTGKSRACEAVQIRLTGNRQF